MPTLAPDYTPAELLDYGQQYLHQLNNPPACESEHHAINTTPIPHDGPGHYWVIFHACPAWKNGGTLTLRCRTSIDALRRFGRQPARCQGCGLILPFEQFCTIIGTVND